MNQGTNRTALVAVLVAAGLLALFLLFGRNTLSWQESYDPQDRNPYGTVILQKLLRNARGGQPFVEITDTLASELPADPGPGVDNYVYIGGRLFIDSADARRLREFLEAGNAVFIFSDDLSNRLLDSILVVPDIPGPQSDGDTLVDNTFLLPEEDYEAEMESESVSRYLFDSTIVLTLNDTAVIPYPLCRRFEYRKVSNAWVYLHPRAETDRGATPEVLGQTAGGEINWVRFPYGRGNLYICTTPLVFTNYFMLSDTAADYARAALSRLGEGFVYWDEENRDFDPNAFEPDDQSGLPDEGPLEFILSEPPLRNAWYLLLTAGTLYLLFGARRTQRIIPVTDQMRNTSIEYAGVISQLFMRQSDHKKLVQLKMDLFRAHLRERYKLRLSGRKEDETPAFFSLVSARSGVRTELVQAIFEQYHYLADIEGVDTPTMLEFHQRLETFYSESK